MSDGNPQPEATIEASTPVPQSFDQAVTWACSAALRAAEAGTTLTAGWLTWMVYFMIQKWMIWMVGFMENPTWFMNMDDLEVPLFFRTPPFEDLRRSLVGVLSHFEL